MFRKKLIKPEKSKSTLILKSLTIRLFSNWDTPNIPSLYKLLFLINKLMEIQNSNIPIKLIIIFFLL